MLLFRRDAVVLVSAGAAVVFGWIWRGKPTSDTPLQLVTFDAQSVRVFSATDNG